MSRQLQDPYRRPHWPDLIFPAHGPGQRPHRVCRRDERGGALVTPTLSSIAQLAHVTSYTAGRIERLFVNFTAIRSFAQSRCRDLPPDSMPLSRSIFSLSRLGTDARPALPDPSASCLSRFRRELLLLALSRSDRALAARKPFYSTTILSQSPGSVNKLVVPTQYVMRAPRFEIADLSNVPGRADVYAQVFARASQRVAISSPALRESRFRLLSFIAPVWAPDTTPGVRIELPIDLQLKPDISLGPFSAEPGDRSDRSPRSGLDRGRRQFAGSIARQCTTRRECHRQPIVERTEIPSRSRGGGRS